MMHKSLVYFEVLCKDFRNWCSYLKLDKCYCIRFTSRSVISEEIKGDFRKRSEAICMINQKLIFIRISKWSWYPYFEHQGTYVTESLLSTPTYFITWRKSKKHVGRITFRSIANLLVPNRFSNKINLILFCMKLNKRIWKA